MKRLRVALAALLSAAFFAGFTSMASADPDTAAEAKETLDKIEAEASELDQEIIEAADRAEKAKTELAQTTKDMEAQEAKVSDLSDDLGELAIMQFQSSGFDMTTQLLTSESSENFLSRLGTLQNETDRSNADLQNLQVEQAKLTELQETATETEAAITADLAKKKELAEEYDKKEAEAQQVYDDLNAAEQARLAQLQAEAATQQEADIASQESASRSTDALPTATGDASSRALQAVEIAKSKVGLPYVYATSGPNTFDCSGFTSYAYRQVGINLPRSSRAQSRVGTPVAISDLQPGDLVFYYFPVSHAAIYIGNGKIADAANRRTGSRIANLYSMPINSARRVA